MSEADGYRPIQDGLRAAGRYLDDNAQRLVSLSVVTEGIVLGMAATGDLRLPGSAVLLTHDALCALTAHARATRGHAADASSVDPLLPTGYEDYCRALGAVAAHSQWTWLRLIRFPDEFLLRFGDHRQRQELVLSPSAVHALLNQAFLWRSSGRGQS